ncbi:hypothetical protein P692DRAFT_20866642 [Suillus brevipes Sb2]|nr:hypothetical protein P692DRAFT_20866642 [Suillus brevipes Sb2]
MIELLLPCYIVAVQSDNGINAPATRRHQNQYASQKAFSNCKFESLQSQRPEKEKVKPRECKKTSIFHCGGWSTTKTKIKLKMTPFPEAYPTNPPLAHTKNGPLASITNIMESCPTPTFAVPEDEDEETDEDGLPWTHTPVLAGQFIPPPYHMTRNPTLWSRNAQRSNKLVTRLCTYVTRASRRWSSDEIDVDGCLPKILAWVQTSKLQTRSNTKPLLCLSNGLSFSDTFGRLPKLFCQTGAQHFPLEAHFHM